MGILYGLLANLVIVIFFVIWFIGFFGSLFSSKFPQIKNFVVKTVVIGMITIFLIMFLLPSLSISSSDLQSETIADGFTIEKYNLDLNVKEDNKVDVTETLLVNWEEDDHHGIYQFVPNWLKYTSKDGKTIKRKSVVKDLRTDLEPYENDRVNKKDRIKIGYASKYVDLGLHTYEIKYTYDMGRDPYKNFDEFIFHGFGDYWGTEIKNASMNITMPKSVEGYNINFFTDKYRKENVNEYVNYSVKDNKINLYFDNYKYSQNTNKTLDKSLTVDIELPNNYFTKGSYNYGFKSILVIIIIIGFTILIIYWFTKYGKDNKKIARTIEFYPPDDLDSSEIGYIYSNADSKKLVISLIVSLAAKKYIKIDQDKKDIIITDLNCLPELKKGDIKHLIVINKLKDIDDNLTIGQKSLMEYLFKNGDTKELTAKFSTFEKHKDYLIENDYIEIVYDNTKEYEMEKQKLKEKYEKDYAEFEKNKRKLDIMSNNERVVYDELFKDKDVVNLKEHKTFYKVFGEVSNNLNNNLKYKLKDKVSHKHTIISIIITILVVILSVLNYSLIEDLDPNLDVLYKISFLCIPICGIFTLFMERKTQYGELIKAKVNGFRHFLTTAEKDQLEKMVEQNPQYFYNILPYTYVLGVSRKWIKKFEDINIPQPDLGNFDYNSMSSWNDISSSVYVPSSSTGSSSCGGGCSSCGGGCSSCGGGGSW